MLVHFRRHSILSVGTRGHWRFVPARGSRRLTPPENRFGKREAGAPNPLLYFSFPNETVDLKVEVRSILKKRSRLSLAVTAFVAVAVSFTLLGCGKNFYFAGRTLPPSGVLNRVLVAVQNPSPLSKGALVFDDALYDIRHAFNNININFSISGFSGALPITIQSMPEQQIGAVYSIGDGSLTTVSYASEKVLSTVA